MEANHLSKRLEGRTALITGASRGIGRGIALKFAQEGADLFLCATKMEKLKETKELASTSGRTIELYTVDVAERDAVEAMVQKAIDSLGKIDTTIAELDQQVAEVKKISDQLSENSKQFAGITGAGAESLLKPIKIAFAPLLVNIQDIQVMFPFILVIIVAFISVIFSNIMILDETHSSAYFRNYIAPINDKIFLIGLFISTMFVIFIQITMV